MREECRVQSLTLVPWDISYIRAMAKPTLCSAQQTISEVSGQRVWEENDGERTP
jgi:hypothetical protein